MGVGYAPNAHAHLGLQLAEIIMDSYGGSGIVEFPDVRYLLNSRCLSIAGGTEQILLTLAGKRLLGLPR